MIIFLRKPPIKRIEISKSYSKVNKFKYILKSSISFLISYIFSRSILVNRLINYIYKINKYEKIVLLITLDKIYNL